MTTARESKVFGNTPSSCVVMCRFETGTATASAGQTNRSAHDSKLRGLSFWRRVCRLWTPSQGFSRSCKRQHAVFQQRRRRSRGLSTALVIGMLIGCHAYGNQYTGANDGQSAAQNPLNTLDERARAYWDARVAGDLVATYELEIDKITGRLTLSQYVRRKGHIDYISAKVLNTEIIERDQAVANVVVEARVPGLPGALTSEFKDKWVYVEGAWYHGQLDEKFEK